MKNKIFYLIIGIIILFSINQVDAVSLKNVGGVDTYGKDQVNSYDCNGTLRGVIQIQDLSTNNYFCIDCSVDFPCTDWAGCSNSYSYSPSDFCYLTCTNPGSNSNANYGSTQHNIWDIVKTSDYNRVSCSNGLVSNIDNNDLLDMTCLNNKVYVLIEYAYQTYQSIAKIESVTATEAPTNGHLKISKTCEAGINPITNFNFTIKDSNGVTRATPTVSCASSSQVYELPVGEYTIIETALSNDIAITSSKIVSVTASYTTSVPLDVPFTNNLVKGSIKIIKLDGSNNTRMEGVTFKLLKIVNGEEVAATYASYGQAGADVGTVTTNSNGEITINNLLYGTYKVVELSTPESNYVIAQPQTVTVNSTTPNVEITITNNPIKLKIIKTDINGTTILNGAHFIIYDKATKTTIREITIDSNTNYIPLDPGEYTFEESTPPVGYDALQTSFDVIVKDDGNISLGDQENEYVTLTTVNNESALIVKNDTKKTTISKKDSSTLKELAGASLKITTSNDTVVAEWITTDTPKRIYLTPGSYILTEISAPSNYTTISKPLTFQILEDGTIKLDNTADTNTYYAKDNVLTIYNTKPIIIPNTGIGLKIALVISGIALIGLGGYVLIKKYKNQNQF